MKEKFSIKISQEDKDEALLKGLKKGGREKGLETGTGAFSIKGGPHKSKRKYNRKDKHRGAGRDI